MPLCANGDIDGAELGNKILAAGGATALMIGRFAVVKPWIFRQFSEPTFTPDYRDTWSRFYSYVLEDFRPEKALGRLREFVVYFAQNFYFGHNLHMAVLTARTPALINDLVVAFLNADPQLEKSPSVMGL